MQNKASERTDPNLTQALSEAARLLATAEKIAVLTGAGVSAESGVPTFRGSGGLWEGYRAEELATPSAFRRDPDLVWSFYRWRLRLLSGVVPNAAHRALVTLEANVPRFWLLTQNVDGLHAAAGSRAVVELHGSLQRTRCSLCSRRSPMLEIPQEGLPTCWSCGGLLRPDVVWFGEMLPGRAMAAAAEAVGECDLMLVVGTSGVVEPAASFAHQARLRGASVLEVNLEPTPISTVARVSLHGRAAELVPHLVELSARQGG